jgi:hypothetical protein
VVAHAFKERRYWNEVDQAGEDYRQQPGDRQLPAWIPTSHHFPLYTAVERIQQACRAIGGKKQHAYRASRQLWRNSKSPQ